MIAHSHTRELQLAKWEQHRDDFAGADLLLGNGFSMNISSSFRYDSLFQVFLDNCSPDEINLFTAFRTTNFEAIQKDLQSAIQVNSFFGFPTNPIKDAVDKLRDGLIQAIETSHPRAQNRNEQQLYNLLRHFVQFGDIFTLNYDLLLYHIIMLSVRYRPTDISGTLRRYNDYFWQTAGPQHLEFMDFNRYKDHKHVYYLHGALFLFNDAQTVLKLKRTSDEELIDRVAEHIRRGMMPLFVSEGTWQDKLSVINRNQYLRFAYDNLRKSNQPIVIYGASLSKDHDMHIVNAVNSRNADVAISIYAGSKNEEQIQAEMHDFCSKLPYANRIVFFESTTLFDFDTI